MIPSDSVDSLLTRLRDGDESAAREVFDRFAGRLIGLAREHLRTVPTAKVEPDDVLQSVFRSFFLRQRAGRFTIHGWGDLWGLLTVITLRKCRNQVAYYRAGLRDAGREVADAVRWTALDRDPTPAEAATLADSVGELTRRLSPRDRAVLELHLQGYTAGEIAARIGRAVRTVWRSIERIRSTAEDLLTTVDAS